MSSTAARESTTAGIPTSNRPASVWARRSMLALMALITLAALLTTFGVHSSQASTNALGYRVDVVYPRVARAGLDVPWEATVTRDGGFGSTVRVAVSAHYFDLYEGQGFRPEPSDETREGDTWYLTFAAPPGDTFRVYFDAYIQPGSQVGRSGWFAVVDSGRLVARTHFSTWLWP